MREPGLFSLIIILAFFGAGVMIAFLPFQIRLFYEGGRTGHTLLLRFSIINEKIGIGSKILLSKDKKENRRVFKVKEKTGFKFFSRPQRAIRLHFLLSWRDFRNYYLRFRKIAFFIKSFMKKSICKRFIWKTRIGFGNYAATGMAVGIVWALKGFLFGYLSRFLKFGPSCIKVCVIPSFGRTCYENSLDCILEARLGHIIIEFLKFIVWWMKGLLKKVYTN